MSKNASLKDTQISKNIKKKQKMTHESNFHTPLELCLRLQYRSSRKYITKTNFSLHKTPESAEKVNKPTREMSYNESRNYQPSDKLNRVDIQITPEKLSKKILNQCSNTSIDSNYKIIADNYRKSFYNGQDSK